MAGECAALALNTARSGTTSHGVATKRRRPSSRARPTQRDALGTTVFNFQLCHVTSAAMLFTRTKGYQQGGEIVGVTKRRVSTCYRQLFSTSVQIRDLFRIFVASR